MNLLYTFYQYRQCTLLFTHHNNKIAIYDKESTLLLLGKKYKYVAVSNKKTWG